MGLGKDFANGIISPVISVGIPVAMADDDDGPWGLLALAVGLSAFLSGFFTSYFAE